MTALVVDLFGGAGGFALGAHQHAPHAEVVSLEIDDDACATQDANDMRFKQTDLSDPAVADEWLSELNNVEAFHLHASPPCQTFSVAGKGEGRKHLDTLAEAVGVALAGGDPSSLLGQVPEGSRLSVAPAIWIARLKPDTVSMEQVRTVLPLWEAYETGMQALGYQTWAGVLYSEQYGVPQTRRRAWLMARRGYQPVSAPAPTHSKYHNRKPDCLDAGVLPWVSMAEAIGWGMTARPSVTIPAAGTSGGGPRPKARRLTSEEAAILQGFPSGYVFTGSKTSQFRQIGNAVNPPVAAAVLRSLGW